MLRLLPEFIIVKAIEVNASILYAVSESMQASCLPNLLHANGKR